MMSCRLVHHNRWLPLQQQQLAQPQGDGGGLRLPNGACAVGGGLVFQASAVAYRRSRSSLKGGSL